MSLEILIPIGILAFLDTLSPTTLGVTVYMLLTEKERLTRRLFVYLFTVAFFYFTVGVCLMLGLDTILQKFSDFSGNVFPSQLMTFIGLGLVIGSFFVPTKSSSKPRKPKSKRVSAMVILGLTTGLIEVGTALPYFAAVGIMTAAKLPPEQWIPILASYNFIMILPPLILIGLHTLFRNWLEGPLERLRLTIEKNSGSTLSWIIGIAGVIILVNA